MNRTVTFEKKPLTLTGRALKPDTMAPNFTVTSPQLQNTTLTSFDDRIKVITFFLSIDTPVCDIQVREFNKIAADLSDDVAVIGISRDLPFAQKRFCETFNIKNISLLSDYKLTSFGINYGVLIKELNLLTRGVVIIDRGNILRYFQIVNEISNQPDFEDTIENLTAILKNPQISPAENFSYECKSGVGEVSPLPAHAIAAMMPRYSNWELINDKKIARQFRFENFVESKYFLNLLSVIAEEQDHHPSFVLNYNQLKVTLTTPPAGGLTENDFIMAGIIDQLEA